MNFQNVGISFGRPNKPEYWALKDVSFDLQEGETLGVIGENGAGKSTLLRTMAGIFQADKGIVTRHTESCALLTLQLGFVPYLNGYDNVILSGMIQGMDKKTVTKRVDHILEFSELGDKFYEPINTWSTGMVARLGFALALEIKPKILLIDETLSVGDEAFRKKSATAIENRIRSNQTVVLVSHSLETLKSFCNRLLWIEKGETKQLGETEEVIQNYQKHINQKIENSNG